MKHLDRLRDWLAEQPNMEVLYVKYADLIKAPEEQSRRVSEFLGGKAEPKAMEPPWTLAVQKPQARRRPAVISRLSPSLSSRQNALLETLRPAERSSTDGGLGCGLCVRQRDRDHQSRPSVACGDLALVTSTARRAMASPRPTPPLARLRSFSTRKKGLKMSVRRASGTPVP